MDRADYSSPSAALPLQMEFRFFKPSTRGRFLQPERRSGFRIVTLKNAAWFALSLTVLFLIFSAYMERRSRGESSYGRLYDGRIDDATRPAAPPAQQPTTTTAPPPR